MTKRTLIKVLVLVALSFSVKAYGAGGGDVDGNIAVTGDGVVTALDETYSGPYDIVNGASIDIGTLAGEAAIEATAVGEVGGASGANGIYTNDASVTVDNLSGDIRATGGKAFVDTSGYAWSSAMACGISSDEATVIGSLSGRITATGGTATSNSGEDAAEAYADANGIITEEASIGALSGTITATGGNATARGMYGVFGYARAVGLDAGYSLSAETFSGVFSAVGGDVRAESIDSYASAETDAIGFDLGAGASIEGFSGNVSATGGTASSEAEEESLSYAGATVMEARDTVILDTFSGALSASGGTALAHSVEGISVSNALARAMDIEGSLIIGDFSGSVTATGGTAKTSGAKGSASIADAEGIEVDDLFSAGVFSGTVTAIGGTAEAEDFIDWSTVTSADASGLDIDGPVTVDDFSGNVAATAGSATTYSKKVAEASAEAIGIRAEGLFSVGTFSGAVTALGRKADATSEERSADATTYTYGLILDCPSDIDLFTGSVTATGGTASAEGLASSAYSTAGAEGLDVDGFFAIDTLTGSVNVTGGSATADAFTENSRSEGAAESWVYGLDLDDGAAFTLFSGTVTATAGIATASGYNAAGRVNSEGIEVYKFMTAAVFSGTVTALGGTSEVTGAGGAAIAEAYAIGLDLQEDAAFGELSGTVTATGGTAVASGGRNAEIDTNARGLDVDDLLTIDTLSGSVRAEGGSATASSENAYAIVSANAYGFDLGAGATIGVLSGTVSAKGGDADASSEQEADSYVSARALDIDAGATIDILSGNVVAEGGTGVASSSDGGAWVYADAYGMQLDDGVTIGVLSGTVHAQGGDATISTASSDAFTDASAHGIDGGDRSVSIGTLSGKVSATGGTATVESAYNGMANAEAIGITGFGITIDTLSGTVTATGGEVSVTSETQGEITADAVAILGKPGSPILIGSENDPSSGISGLVKAEAGGGWDAYAIFSEASEDDFIAMSGSGQLIGDVSLTEGEDTMLVRDNAIISTVPILDGGEDNDLLAFRGWEGTFGPSIVNWEEIELTEGTNAMLPSSTDDLDPYTLAFDVFTIDGTSTLDVSGSSPGYYTLQGDVSSSGVISQLDNGDTDDRLTIEGSYEGRNGAAFAMDVKIGERTADQVTITGDADGSTVILVNPVGGLSDVDEPILLVTVNEEAGPGTLIGSEQIFGPKIYQSEIGSEYQEGNTWFFSLIDFVDLGYTDNAALMQAVGPFAERLGYESVMKFHERRSYGWPWYDKGERESVWVRLTGSKYRMGFAGDAATAFEGYTGWVQVGSDLVAGGDEGTRAVLGVFGGAGYGEAEVDGIISGKAGELEQEAYGVGAYLSLHERGSWYIDVVGQAIWNDLDIDGQDEAFTADNWSWVASLETGGCIEVSPSFRLEPQAQLIYQQRDGMTFMTADGKVTLHEHDGLQGRVSVTGIGGSSEGGFHPFIEGTVVKEFSEDRAVTWEEGSYELTANPEEWYAGGSVGFSYSEPGDNGFGLYVKGSGLWGLDGEESWKYAVTAGVRTAL